MLLLTVLLAGCAPRLQPPSGMTVTPQLTESHLVMEDGATLPLRRWLPETEPEAVVLALHGFNEYSAIFDAAAEYWRAQGIATYAYDQRGFGATAHRGLWPGDDRLIGDLRTTAMLLRMRHPDRPLHLLGVSMGSAVIMAASASPSPPPADGLILVAPAIWGWQTQKPLHKATLWLTAHTMPWLRLTGRGLKIRPSDNVAVLRARARDPLIIKETRVDAIYGLVGLMDKSYAAAATLDLPALLLYGGREQVIPQTAALSMLRRLPPRAAALRRVAFYPRGYHMLLHDLGAAVVLRDIATWITDRKAPLPSGADALAETTLAAGSGRLPVIAEEAAGDAELSAVPVPAGAM